MSENLIISLIGSATTILVVVLSRLMSHYEHKATAKKIHKIYTVLNGKD